MNPFLQALGFPDPDDENPFLRVIRPPRLPKLGADIEAAGGLPGLGPDPSDRERTFGDYAERFTEAVRSGAASVVRMPGDAARYVAQTFATPNEPHRLPEGAEVVGPGSYRLSGEDFVRSTPKPTKIAHPYDYYLGEDVADTAFEEIDRQNIEAKGEFRSRRGNPFLTAALDTGVEAASVVADPTNWLPAGEAVKLSRGARAAGAAERAWQGSILDMPLTRAPLRDRAVRISEERIQALVNFNDAMSRPSSYDERLHAWAATQGVDPDVITPDLEDAFLRVDSPEHYADARVRWLETLPPAEREALAAATATPTGPAARSVLDMPLGEAYDYFRASLRGEAGSFEAGAQADALEGAIAPQIVHPLAPPPASGEAGFIKLGGTPPPPPRPIRKYMVGEEPAKSGRDMLRDFGRRWAQQVTNADDPIERYGRVAQRKGAPAPELGKRLEQSVAGLRGVAELARGPITRGTRLFNPATGDYAYTGESARNILGGLDQRTLTDLEDFNAAKRQLELAGRADAASVEWSRRLADRRAAVEQLRQAGNAQRAGVRALEGDARQALAREIRLQRAEAKAGSEAALRGLMSRRAARRGRIGEAGRELDSALGAIGRQDRAQKGLAAVPGTRPTTNAAFTAGRQVAKDEAKRKAAQLRLPRAERPGDLGLQVNAQATVDARDTLADIAQTWGARLPELESLARRYQDWKIRATLNPLVEIGWMTPAARQTVIDSNEFHAMFSRAVDGVYAHILEDRVGQGLLTRDEALRELFGREGAQSIVAGSTKGDPLKRISAGLGDDLTALIRPTLEADLTKVQSVHRWIERQRVRNVLGDLADVDPVVAREVVPTGKRNPAAPFMSKEEFAVWRGGESFSYVAPTDTLRALERLTPRQAHWAMKIARTPAKIVRTTATLGLEFMARNPVRDIQGAMVSAESGFLPQDFLYGLLAQAPGQGGPRWLQRARGMADEWASAGGAMSTMAQMDTAAAKATLADASQGRGAIDAIRGGLRHWREEIKGDWVGGALYPLQVASGVAEKATRIGVYANARRGGRKQIAGLAIPGTRGGPQKSMLAAMAEARDATIDFGRAGESGRVVNSLYAFANAEIQDVSKLYRNFRDRPLTTTARVMAYVVAPTAIAWQMNRDDADYKDRQEWEKVVYLHLWKNQDGSTFRLPRPAGIVNAFFSYGMEKLLDELAGEDPRAGDKLVQSLTELTPAHWVNPADWVPTAGKGPVQAAYNWDDWKGLPIDPAYQQDVLPEYRGMDDENLPQVFKDASRGINEAFPGLARRGGRAYEMTSPYRLQHIFRSYTTSFGRYATDALRAADQDPATKLPVQDADTPGLRAFLGRKPIGWSSKPVSDMYTIYREASTAKETADRLRKEGRINEWMKVQADHPELKIYGQIQSTRAQLNAWKKLRDQMKAAPGMTPEARQNMLMQWDQMATSYAGAQLQWMAPLLER